MARAAYGSQSAVIRTPRSIEYDAFARVTHQIKSAISGPAPSFATLTRALNDNRNLWLTLASDVAEPSNGLPQALRAQLFYLAEFTNQHTSKVLAGEAEAGVLIEINTAVMRGLRPGEGAP